MADADHPKRPRGRPRLQEPGAALTCWIPAPAYDALARQACRQGLTLSALTRRLVTSHLRAPGKD